MHRLIVACLVLVAVLVARVASAFAAVATYEVCSGCTYRSISAALQVAHPGDTIRVDRGTYPGPLVIDRSIHLEGVGWPILDGQGRGTVVRVTAPDVSIRGFVLRNSGASYDQEDSGVVVEAADAAIIENQIIDTLFGVYLKNAAHSRVEGNLVVGRPLAESLRGDGIKVWYSPGVRITGNTVSNSRDCLLWFSDDAVLRDNTITGGRYGLHFMYGNGSLVEHNRIEDNSVGIYLMYGKRMTIRDNLLSANRGPSGYGLGIKEVDGATVTGNLIRDNRVGLFVDNSPLSPDSRNIYRGNILAANDTGLLLTAADRNGIFSQNSLIENVTQVSIEGGGTGNQLQWSEDGLGNYWSDYVGYVGPNGIVGAVPYEDRRLSSRLMDQYPLLQLFRFSAAAEALDLAARTFPVFQPDPIVVDPAPLVRPVPAIGAPWEPSASPWPARVVMAGFFGLAASVLAWGTGPRPNPRGQGSQKGAIAAPSASTSGGLTAQPVIRLDQVTARRSQALPTLNSDAIIAVSNLGKAYDSGQAVKDVTFTVRQGEALALWGPNGAGKTTILRCLLGRTSYQGTISIATLSPACDGKRIRELIGFVPQDPLGFDLPVAELIHLIARLRGTSPDQAFEQLARFGLHDHRDQPVTTLSGGGRQKLAIALALIGQPPILLLDEPTANLDASSRRELLDILGDLKRQGQTIVFTSHRWSDIAALADRVIHLEGGRLVRVTTLERRAACFDLTLRIRLGEDRLRAASALLADHGFPTLCNGSSVAVAVAHDQKAAPLSLLARAGFPIVDFEVEDQP